MSNNGDSDQTRQMPRLILVFAGCKAKIIGFVLQHIISYSTGYDWTCRGKWDAWSNGTERSKCKYIQIQDLM